MKKLLCAILVLSLALSLVACAPKGDPEVVITTYYQRVMDGNYSGAYETLAANYQAAVSEKDFVYYLQVNNESKKFKSFKVEKASELKNKQLGESTYSRVVEFTVTETTLNYIDDKETNMTYTREVVADGGEWKVFRSSTPIGAEIGSALNNLGWMYRDGKEEKNLNQAAVSFVKATKDYGFTDAYYGLGVVYLDLGRYDEASAALQSYVSRVMIYSRI